MYAKLFASIYQGTLRGNTHGLVVFTNMLAHADSNGWVDIHPRAIAEEVGLSVEQVRAALLELEAPDPESRSPEEGGRRIIRMDEHRDWGWIVVNHAKYRAIRSEEDRREQNRLAQQRFREKSNQSKPRKPISAQAEAEAEVNNTLSGKTPDVSLANGKEKFKDTAEAILVFLNEKTKKNFKPVKVNLDLIAERLKEGATEAECRAVIVRRVKAWTGTDMEPYLRPSTLFNRTKFAQYVGEVGS